MAEGATTAFSVTDVTTLKERMQAIDATSTEQQRKAAADAAKVEKDFYWAYTEEPHRTRRQAILKAHPEISKLNGHEPLTKYVVLLVLAIQFTCAYLLRNTPVLSWRFFLTAYIIGATANQNIFLAIHEMSHNLGFKSTLANRLFSIVANLPIGLPYSAAFRGYHIEHHKFLGVDGIDTDLPTKFEAMLLHNILGKAFFCTFQILFYAIRPVMVKAQPFTRIHYLNLLTQLSFDYLVIHYLTPNALYYLILSSFLAGSLHPVAGHFIAEHYVFDNSNLNPAETYSYYGPLNLVTYNVGYHNEHHDFPFVAWTRLPELRRVASEFYEPLPRHGSWTRVIWEFIWSGDVGMYSRVKRKEKKVRMGEMAKGL
ncbi:sphingolipid delta-4 desaturase [Saitoella coloradoensis]